jgi:hypothetical protein
MPSDVEIAFIFTSYKIQRCTLHTVTHVSIWLDNVESKETSCYSYGVACCTAQELSSVCNFAACKLRLRRAWLFTCYLHVEHIKKTILNFGGDGTNAAQQIRPHLFFLHCVSFCARCRYIMHTCTWPAWLYSHKGVAIATCIFVYTMKRVNDNQKEHRYAWCQSGASLNWCSS